MTENNHLLTNNERTAEVATDSSPAEPSKMVLNPPPAVSNNAKAFNALLEIMLKAGDKVSDLIFSPGRAPQVELTGRLREVNVSNFSPLTVGHIKTMADIMLQGNATGLESLEERGSADISYSVPGLCRFRVNIFRQRGSLAIVMRVIPTKPPNWEDLDLPKGVISTAQLKNGLVLVTGPTGSGKSTTLAAIIDLINSTLEYHIVTIEDPIEFTHDHKKGTIHQREIHSDTKSFADALRAALRQAPKVILVGEMRDRETIEIAMEAAETGHLVLSTLHTIDASKTIDRILGVFPKVEEQAIRTRLAQSFRAIISQRLLPKIGGGRIAAIEILKSNSRTRDYIEKGEKEGKSMTDAMNDSGIEGMQSFDKVIEEMVRTRKVSLETGLAHASNTNNLRLALGDFIHEEEQARKLAEMQ